MSTLGKGFKDLVYRPTLKVLLRCDCNIIVRSQENSCLRIALFTKVCLIYMGSSSRVHNSLKEAEAGVAKVALASLPQQASLT
ncbi:hypothetical protein EJB05_14096, partial [Eragrostis curvula]